MKRATPPMPDDPGAVYCQDHEDDSLFWFERLHPAVQVLFGGLMFCGVVALAYWLYALDRIAGR